MPFSLVLPTHADQLLDDLERPLLALELVALVLDPLDEEVLDVRHHVGEGEGDVVVLAQGDTRQAWDRGAAAEAPAELQAELVPDTRHPAGQMRVAGEQGAAGLRASGRHRPVVRAAGRRGQADLLAHATDLLRQSQAVAVESLPGMEHHRVSLRVGGIDLRGALLAELADQVRTEQLPLPVGREPEREQLAPGQHVGRAPGLEVEAEQLELGRWRRRDSRRLVEAGAVGVEQAPEVGVELRFLAQRHPAQAQRAHQPVDRETVAPGDLADPAGGDPAVHLALPEAVLAVAEALAEPEVDRRLGTDGRHPPAISDDLYPPLEAADPEIASGAGEWPAKELPPQAGRRPAEESRTDSHPLGAGPQ